MSRPNFKQPIPNHARLVFHGILFDVYQWDQQMYDGSTKTFEKLVRRDTATVIAVTNDRKILMTKQEQPGMRALMGLPGGAIDHGEDPLKGVQRELLEETGYEAPDWEKWQTIQPHEKINYFAHTYIAKHAQQVRAAQGDEGEKIELMLVSFDEFVHLMADDEFRDDEVAFAVLKTKARPGALAEFKRLLGL